MFFFTLKKKLFTFIGDIKWAGITRPFWFTINASGYKLNGTHYREVIKLLNPGDILLRRFEGYIDKWLIPGWWNHAGIYIGGESEEVVHAISDGVKREDVLNFMRTDHMIVLRKKSTNSKYRDKVVERALSIVGKPYDFDFDFDKANRFSCTELAAYCHSDIKIDGKRRWNSLWKKVLVADDFLACNKLKVVWDSRQSG